MSILSSSPSWASPGWAKHIVANLSNEIRACGSPSAIRIQCQVSEYALTPEHKGTHLLAHHTATGTVTVRVPIMAFDVPFYTEFCGLRSNDAY